MKRLLVTGLMLSMMGGAARSDTAAPPTTLPAATAPVVTAPIAPMAVGAAPVFDAPAQCGPVAELSAEYLYWWIKRPSIDRPLITSSTNPVMGLAGSPQDPLARNVLGPGEFGPNGQSGVRLGGTIFLGEGSNFGINASGFWLARETNTFALTPDTIPDPLRPGARILSPGSPSFYQPVLSVVSGIEVPFQIIERNFGLRANPPIPNQDLLGTYRMSTSSSLHGWEVNGVYDFSRDPNGLSLRGLAGFRQIGLRETFTETVKQTTYPPSSVAVGGLAALYPFGLNSFTRRDAFAANTDFYGAQVGLRARYQSGGLGVDLTGKVALGVSQERAHIDGATFVGDLAAAPGGLRAVPSIMGRHSRSEFAVAPEVGLNVLYAVTPNVSLSVGYNFLYLSNVVRALDQLPPAVDTRQVPSSGIFGQTTAEPPLRFEQRSTDFWAHGITAGLALSF